MNNQEYYDITAQHLRSMGSRSFGTSFSTNGAPRQACLYRSPSGTACAVGVHIPDGHSALGPRYNGFAVSGIAERFPDLAGIAWPEEGTMLAIRLQHVHDEETNWNEMGFIGEYDLQIVCGEFGLKYTPPVELEDLDDLGDSGHTLQPRAHSGVH